MPIVDLIPNLTCTSMFSFMGGKQKHQVDIEKNNEVASQNANAHSRR